MSATYRAYVLQNHDSRFYIGVTGDLGNTIEQANAGQCRWAQGQRSLDSRLEKRPIPPQSLFLSSRSARNYHRRRFVTQIGKNYLAFLATFPEYGNPDRGKAVGAG